jgi:5-formyltetrahydrofolate cyclo-ligase
VADEKKKLRAILAECRDALDNQRCIAVSAEIQRRVVACEFFSAASAIVLYASLGNEVSTDLLLNSALASGRPVFFPRVDTSSGTIDTLSGTIVARRVRDRSELVRGAFGIMEPPPGAEPLSREQFTRNNFAKILVCVPGLGFGPAGQRLGRGGGHYDRFLADFGPEAITVGLAYSFQLLDRIPEAGHDRRLNFIVTESDVHPACEAPLPADETRTKEVNPGGIIDGNPGIHSWWRGLFHLGDNETA